MKMKRKRRSLKREILEVKAQIPSRLHFAAIALKKLNVAGSGVILEVTALGGESIVQPTMIHDGFSKETIDCMIEDMIKSHALATSLKPTRRIG